MKLLMIAYFYSPMAGPGRLRTEAFEKYLPEFGIRPII